MNCLRQIFFHVDPWPTVLPAAGLLGMWLGAALAMAADSPARQSEKVVIAHRGASAYLPEHTLEAYAMAYGQGAHYIEPDLVLTKDGVPIALHDITLDATTDVAEVFPGRTRPNGRHYAADFTLEEIKTLRVRERVRPGTNELVYPGRFPNTHAALVFRVPTLAELIELVQGLNHSTGRTVGIYPELKTPGWHAAEGHDFERALLDVLAKYGYRSKTDPVIIQSFEAASLLRLRELGGELRLVQLIGGGRAADAMVTAEGLDRIAAYADGIGPALGRLLDREGNAVDDNALVTGAHARGMVVHPWTLRADALPPYAPSFEWLVERLLFDLGADGAFTDHPDLMVKALAGRAARAD